MPTYPYGLNAGIPRRRWWPSIFTRLQPSAHTFRVPAPLVPRHLPSPLPKAPLNPSPSPLPLHLPLSRRNPREEQKRPLLPARAEPCDPIRSLWTPSCPFSSPALRQPQSPARAPAVVAVASTLRAQELIYVAGSAAAPWC